MKITCPHCGRNFEVDDVNAGREADCTNCGKRFVLQADAGPAVPVRMTAENRACPYCGGEIDPGVKKCRHCGEWLDRTGKTKDPVVFVLLALFLGKLGIHNFYVGDNIKGISKLNFLAVAVVSAIPCVVDQIWRMFFSSSSSAMRWLIVLNTVSRVSWAISLILLLVLWARTCRLSDGRFLRVTFISAFVLFTLAGEVVNVLFGNKYGYSLIGGIIISLRFYVSLMLTVDAWCVWEMFHSADACKDAR